LYTCRCTKMYTARGFSAPHNCSCTDSYTIQPCCLCNSTVISEFLKSRLLFSHGHMLYSQQPGAVMKIHEAGSVPSTNAVGLQRIKQDELAWPGIAFPSPFQSLPPFKRTQVSGKDCFPGRLAQKHRTDDRLHDPKTTLLPQVDTLHANIGTAQDVNQSLNLLFRGYESINKYVGKKSCNPFTAAACTVMILVTLFRTKVRKMSFQELIDFFPESQIVFDSSLKPYPIRPGNPFEMIPNPQNRFQLFPMIVVHGTAKSVLMDGGAFLFQSGLF
jgi:hypothetical protein